MSFFRDQATRLMRDTWKSAQLLAEELYAIFLAEPGVTRTNPLSVPKDGAQPPLTLTNISPGDTLLQLRGPQGQDAGSLTLEGSNLVFNGPVASRAGIPPLPPSPAINLPGGISFPPEGPPVPLGSEVIPGATIAPGAAVRPRSAMVPLAPGEDAAQRQQPQSSGGGGLPGVVVSGGPGRNYTVRVYPLGLDRPSRDVPVLQLQIDAAETIPAGTATVVTQVGTKYYMQVPVWVAEAP